MKKFVFRGISDESLELSDFNCCIPMNGMVDSFNVSVAAGILMHHAVSDRISKMVIHNFVNFFFIFHIFSNKR